MKKRKITTLLLLAIMSFNLISCDSNKNSQTIQNETSVESTTIEDTAIVEKMFSINDVAKKSSGEVAKVLGQPEKSEESSEYITNYYMNGTVEIAFSDDVAARITVTPQHDTPFYNNSKKQASTLQLIGLNKVPLASQNNLYSDTWDNVSGLYEISVFNNELKNDGNDTVSYIYIITDEIYK
ncbi:hypothetical protein EXM65_10340 [Clostridium botulinum]|uniref:Lipoprotein n=1 Tax=Clostridium botulinum TaxID=1491 RepID=A0A6M0SNT9_CLOBO|nr:hypothetical protein [Clostridium botulinum]NFO10959.1 hypothetical protein [Clostridium botulinum]